MRKLIEIVNRRTGERFAAPSHCAFCGHELGELIRHLIGTSFEVTCEHEGCGKTFIVLNDHQQLA